jgi:hypothetical protein
MFDVPSCEGAAKAIGYPGPRGCDVVDAQLVGIQRYPALVSLCSANFEDSSASISVSEFDRLDM